MIEVVAAVFATSLLPGEDALVALMVDHYTLLEGGVKVFAPVTAIHGNLHSV